MLDWLIIGAGVHGVHLALALLGGAQVERERLRLLDPHPSPLARWRQCSATVGMRFMRSPSVHHLDGPPFSLSNFARELGYNPKREFRAPYNRPSTRLFNEHCDALLTSQRIAELCIRGRAIDLVELDDRLEVVTETERIATHRVVLALGSDQLTRPAWTEALGRDGLRELRRAERRGRIVVRETKIIDARVAQHGGVELWPQAGPIFHADRIVLATGFARVRPGAWLDPAIARLGLRCAECGYPIVDRALRWHARIHVSGGLAELELGPAARNISGARMASERLLEHLCGPRLAPRAQIVRLGTV